MADPRLIQSQKAAYTDSRQGIYHIKETGDTQSYFHIIFTGNVELCSHKIRLGYIADIRCHKISLFAFFTVSTKFTVCCLYDLRCMFIIFIYKTNTAHI